MRVKGLIQVGTDRMEKEKAIYKGWIQVKADKIEKEKNSQMFDPGNNGQNGKYS